MGGTGAQEAFFELRFHPTIALVSTVRRFVTDFYVEILRDADDAQKLAMATHELLENATAYSVDRRSEVTITLQHPSPRVAVAIQTRNRATPERLELVRQVLDEVLSAPDPMALYHSLVKRAAKRRDGGSGLGLGRIRAEADLELTYGIDGDTLTLTAEGLFWPAGARIEETG